MVRATFSNSLVMEILSACIFYFLLQSHLDECRRMYRFVSHGKQYETGDPSLPVKSLFSTHDTENVCLQKQTRKKIARHPFFE